MTPEFLLPKCKKDLMINSLLEIGYAQYGDQIVSLIKPVYGYM